MAGGAPGGQPPTNPSTLAHPWQRWGGLTPTLTPTTARKGGLTVHPPTLQTLAVNPEGATAMAVTKKKKEKSHQRSQLGNQTESGKRSAPSVGFGTASRFGTEAQFITKEHSKQLMVSWTPGPGQYQAKSSVGNQVYSEKKSAAGFGFGTSQRFNEAVQEQKRQRNLPAPGTYRANSSMGHQVNSTQSTGAQVQFGNSLRSQVVVEKGFEQQFFGLESPGPALYSLQDSQTNFKDNKDGKGMHSTGPSFGTDPRATDPKKKNHAEVRAAQVPGPGNYPTPSAFGPQSASNFPSKPQFGFSTLDRSKERRLAGGRGDSHARSSSIGKQMQSEKKSAPRFTFGSQGRFAKSTSTSAQAPGPGSYIV